MMASDAGSSPALRSIDQLGASQAPPTPGAPDPSPTPFAGLLARRMVSLQSEAKANEDSEPATMVEAALASLEAAIADAAPGANAGTSAIRALVEQVSRAAGAVPVVIVDAATQALAGAMMVGQTPAQQLSTALAANTPGAVDKRDGDTKKAATEGDTDGASADAANTAANTATNTPTGTAPVADPSVIVRDTAALDPAFRAKLDRVIDRMESEFGYKVTITETVRSQARQDALYEQGRSTPGQVVTWTRASMHAGGRAADVLIDGSYDNPVAFARLQRIANEEGIHTLGSRDPGHLELRIPTVGGFTAKIAAATPSANALHPLTPAASPVPVTAAEQATSGALAHIARVARVAEVAVAASVAGVARVASVAHVAMPGSSMPTPAVKGATSAGKTSTGDRESNAGGRNAMLPTAADAISTDTAAMPFASAARVASPVAGASAVAGPDQASRVAHIDALGQQAAAQPMSSMVLTMDDGNGGTDRIRVDVRGSSVASTIDVQGQQAAAELSARTGELARALESHGLESESVRVRAMAATAPSTESLRSALGGEASSARTLAGALSASASNPSRRERDEAHDPRSGSSPSQQESKRQRSRREREDQPQ